MEKPRVCRGCFAEWEDGGQSCPYCGWEPEKKYTDMFQWKTGDIFEKRYLLGQIFYRSRDIAVWRVYDGFLEIPCFVLRKLPDDAGELAKLAENIRDREMVEILAIKEIDRKAVLFFSLRDRYLPEKEFGRMLTGENDRNREAHADADERPENQPEPGAVQKDQALTAGTCVDGRYRILECIGIGGFGIVYRCEDLYLSREVALKEYFPAEWAVRDEQYVAVKKAGMLEAYRFGMRSFLKEARISARFIHTPHIVTVYDVLEANDTAYMVMRYISGISIGREMRTRKYRPYMPSEMAEIMLPVLDVLAEIHEKRIVYSDISPGNIMRSDDGEICLIDMGAAKYNLDRQPALSAAFLKIDYSAPEQYRTAKEGRPADEGPWTDIYGVGATMYYLLTGHKPTDVITRLGSRDTRLTPPKKYRVKLSRQWMNVIHQAVALERKDRFQSAAELKKAIENLLK